MFSVDVGVGGGVLHVESGVAGITRLADTVVQAHANQRGRYVGRKVAKRHLNNHARGVGATGG